MIQTIIKQFFIIYSSFYLYRKILNLNPFSKLNQIIFLFSSLLLAIANYYFNIYVAFFAIIFSILSFFCIVHIFLHTPLKLSFVSSTICFGISYMTFSLSTLLVITFFYYFYKNTNQYPALTVIILAGSLSYLLIHIPFQTKRFKKGMQFLYQNSVINSGVILSIILLLLLTLGRLVTLPPSRLLKILPPTIIFLLGFLLLFWWKNQITKSYLEKIRKAELESLRQEIIDKDAEIQKLRENNDSLAHIIHRDNKLIPAMETAVCEFLEDYALLSADDFRARGQALANELKEMSASRTGILAEYQAKGQHIPITGVCSVDALFSYMQKKASSFEITLEVKISTDLLSFTGKVISPDALSHLLSDLIENAIIATKNSPLRKIQVHISFISNHYVVEILDTGEAFPIEILQGFGIEQKTSHASEGGSGIGLMDIWKIKKKYRASLHIQEFLSDNGSFQKKISLIFDSKNHYLIQTYRPQEILMTLKRSDLYVLENET